jgi:hypothetical protein
MRTNFHFFFAVFLPGVLFVLILAACNGIPENAENFFATPSFNPVEEIKTLVPTPETEPSPTLTFTSIPTDSQPALTSTPVPTWTSPPPTATPTLTNPCNRASPGFPRIDVEIDDDTIMLPGQRFTKVWRLANSGSCTWTPDYKVVWFFGAKLGDADSVPLRESVAPGESIDILVDMTAPLEAGTYQSNWKLQAENGDTFGIGPTGSSPFWVRVVVVHTPTPTYSPSPPPPATATPTETPLPTPTPVVRHTGSAEMEVGDLIDLDTSQLNPISGEDLAYQGDDTGSFWILPGPNALLGYYGGGEPDYLGCQQTPLSAAPIGFGSLSLGSYLCLQTDQGYLGWLRLDEVNPETDSIRVEFLVWEKIE